MKKNISINISGIIFNIEEDGYERLKHYLEEIKRYFASYDGSEEIAADIETRIAEIFLSKLGPQKQVITAEDVENLIAQMGNVRDFEVIEEQEAGTYNNSNNEQFTSSSAYQSTTGENKSGEKVGSGTQETPKRFYRDGNRRVVAGVAAGLGNYLGIDPLWVRLFLVVFVFVDPFITLFTVSTALIIAYIVAWIIVPERFDLSEPVDKKTKKIFRDPENKVIGGVASGLAAYLRMDPVILRIVFVVSFFMGGFGFIPYIILWIIIPEAKTITDRMQMQGEPFTISNIEENIKKKLNLNDPEVQGQVAKTVVLPFRFIASVLESAGRALGALLLFLANAVRYIVGIGFAGVGFLFLIALCLAGCFASGFMPELYIEAFDLQFPAYLAQKTFPPFLLITTFFSLLIPGLMVILLGIAFIAKRWILPAAVGWLLLSTWIVSLVATAALAPPHVMHYNVRGQYATKEGFVVNSDKTLVLSLRKTDDLNYKDVRLSIGPGNSDELVLEKSFYARGKNREDARNMAKKSRYAVVQLGDTLLLSQHLHLPEEVPFRAQELMAGMHIPAGQKFVIDPNLRKIFSYQLSAGDFAKYDLEENPVFQYNENGQLTCLECSEN